MEKEIRRVNSITVPVRGICPKRCYVPLRRSNMSGVYIGTCGHAILWWAPRGEVVRDARLRKEATFIP